MGAVDDEAALDAVVVWPRRERRVSWTPGAEGAEVSRAVCVECALWGTMRRDWVSVRPCQCVHERCDANSLPSCLIWR